MRISFCGGGTDFRDFYTKKLGQVISAAINQYVYIVINPTPLVSKIAVRYSISENVDKPEEIKNTRVRAALRYFGVFQGIEVGSFASLPSGAGLGSSSSFLVALIKALSLLKGQHLSANEVAELACHLEINVLNEPMGKQDQFAAAYGGLNVFQFNPDGFTAVTPICLDSQLYSSFQNHLLLFFTGITRSATPILSEQKKNIATNSDFLEKISDSVPRFTHCIETGDFETAGGILHENWEMKKKLASSISNERLDALYKAGKEAGSWGGKISGAGGGGCLLFLAPLDKKKLVTETLKMEARRLKMDNYQEIPVNFTHLGADVLYNHD